MVEDAKKRDLRALAAGRPAPARADPTAPALRACDALPWCAERTIVKRPRLRARSL